MFLFPLHRPGQRPAPRRRLTLEVLEDRLCPSPATIDFSTYLGGRDTDTSLAVAVDGAGNSYVTGLTTSRNFPVTSGAFQTRLSGSQEAFVAKFDPVGGLVYATYLGGNNSTEGFGIAVDQDGDAYVTGVTWATNFPIKNGFQTKPGGGSDAFVAKLNPAGSALLYSTYLGGSGDENSANTAYPHAGAGIAVDQNGNAYVTGGSGSSDFPLRNSMPVAAHHFAFVTRINTNAVGAASLVYSTFLSETFADGVGIAADNAGNAYVTGLADNGLATPGAFLTSGRMAYVAKIDTDLSGSAALVYATYLGSSSIVPEAIAVDAAGDACIAGWVDTSPTPDLPTTANAFEPSPGPTSREAFVTELNPTGSGLIYSTYLGGGGYTVAYGVAIDGAGHIYVTGTTTSPSFPTANAFQPNLAGPHDAFVVELSPAAATGPASLVYGSYLGGGGGSDQVGFGIAVDPYGDAYVTGEPATGFPTANAFQSSYHGAFLTKIAPPA
jgi:hypothetical protein